MNKKQRGFLLVGAIAIIVVAGFFVALYAHMLASGNSANRNYTRAIQSYYINVPGLEAKAASLYPNTISSRSACASSISTTAFGNGQFNVSPGSITQAHPTLTSAISASATSIPLSSTANLAPAGSVMVGRERIRYQYINGNNLTGLTRGINGTVAAAHRQNAYAFQYQCNFNAHAAAPSFAHTKGASSLTGRIALESGWVVGARQNNNLRFSQWNNPTELSWTNNFVRSSQNRTHLRAVSMSNPDDAIAVGDDTSSGGRKFAIWAFNPNADDWQLQSSPPTTNNRYIRDLDGVSVTSDREAWAVGQRSNSGAPRRYTILRELDGTWCTLTSSASSGCNSITIPADNNNNRDLYAVDVISTNNTGLGNFGFAVGQDGQILKYNGITWTQVSSPTAVNLYAVDVVSTSDAWAVGDNGTVLRWDADNGWQVVGAGVPTNVSLHGVAMLDTDNDNLANIGWIVGYRNNRNGRAYRFDNGTWSTHNPTGTANRRLNAISMSRPNDVWAAGNNGRIIHWNGSSWSRISTSGLGTLYGIDIVTPKTARLNQIQENYADNN